MMIALKMTGEGEVFYFQKRIGKNSKYFDIWKFATMLKNSPNMGTGMITVRNDPRLTPLGRFLRKTKINELPQIINVIKGDMSIVGPRPTVEKHANAYGDEIRDKIYSIKPGITGIGSILFRDEEAFLSREEGNPFEFYKNTLRRRHQRKWFDRTHSRFKV
ncbi:MAG: sugar transferase [Saprospiraceae bacterium]|nr:sugar transferase [Saprospiraceae bacterium]